MDYLYYALAATVVFFIAVTAYKYYAQPPVVEQDTFTGGAGNTEYKFVMFGVDWCPHCVKAKPEFEALGATQTIGGKTVACRAIEAEKNPELVRGKVSGYPTIQLYDAQGKLVKEYSGQRTAEGFQTFLEEALNR